MLRSVSTAACRNAGRGLDYEGEIVYLSGEGRPGRGARELGGSGGGEWKVKDNRWDGGMWDESDFEIIAHTVRNAKQSFDTFLYCLSHARGGIGEDGSDCSLEEAVSRSEAFEIGRSSVLLVFSVGSLGSLRPCQAETQQSQGVPRQQTHQNSCFSRSEVKACGRGRGARRRRGKAPEKKQRLSHSLTRFVTVPFRNLRL